jgi:hypothetical protein
MAAKSTPPAVRVTAAQYRWHPVCLMQPQLLSFAILPNFQGAFQGRIFITLIF